MPLPDPTLIPPPATAAPVPDADAPGDARALPAGHRLDAYQLQGTVAATSTSVTYLATDLNLSVGMTLMEYFPVALAWRDSTGLVGPTETRYASAYHRGLLAFVDEARALAQCDHPSLVRVARLWQGGGTAYRVVHRHRKGRTLLDVRRSMTGPPDEASLLSLMDGLLGALDAFHRAGYVHGNLHPGNILLLEDDRPLLLSPDWAGRKLAAEFAGTAVIDDLQPGFAPWEQLAAPLKPLPGAWVDLYALSEVVRFCISGEMPPPVSKRRLGAASEPTADMVRRLFGDALNWRYRNRLLRTLDVAASGNPQDRPDVAQFREWLVNGPPDPDRTKRTRSTTHSSAQRRAGAVGRPRGTEPAGPRAEPPMEKPATHEPAAHEDSNPFLTPEFFERLARATSVGDGSPAATAPSVAPTPHDESAAVPPVSTRRLEPALDGLDGLETGPRDRLDSLVSDWSARETAPPLVAAHLPQAQSARHKRRSALLAAVTMGIVAMAGLGAWWQLRQPDVPADTSVSARVSPSGDPVANPVANPSASPGVSTGTPPATATASNASTLKPSTDAALARAERALNGAPATATPPAPTRPSRDTASATEGARDRSASAAFPLPAEPTAAGPQPAEPQTTNGRSKPANADSFGRAAAARASGIGPRAPTSPQPSPDSTTTRSLVDETTPRGACGTRTLFALYRCMQTQCSQKQWQRHPQCERLKATDDVE